MKKLILLAMMLTTLAAPIRSASAAVAPHLGFFVVLPLVAVTGQAMNKTKGCKLVLCLDKIAGLGVIYAGILLLDEETGNVSFSEVSKDLAVQADITSSERESFNESLEEVNMIKNEIVLEISKVETGHADYANELWKSSKDMLDKDAFRAVQKLRSHLRGQIKL